MATSEEFELWLSRVLPDGRKLFLKFDHDKSELWVEEEWGLFDGSVKLKRFVRSIDDGSVGTGESFGEVEISLYEAAELVATRMEEGDGRWR